METASGDKGLIWVLAWDDAGARNRFVAALQPALGRMPGAPSMEVTDVAGSPGVLFRTGAVAGISHSVTVANGG